MQGGKKSVLWQFLRKCGHLTIMTKNGIINKKLRMEKREMRKTDISKAELLVQRKERKRLRKAEKRKKKIIRFTVKMSVMLFVVSLLYAGVFTLIWGDNPYCDESNTYKYTAKCVDVEEREIKLPRKADYVAWRLRFEDGEVIQVREGFFDGLDKNDLIGKDITFRIYEELGSAGEIIAEISDENGNEYLTFDEYNKSVKDIRTIFSVTGAIVFLIICIGAVSLWYDF
jgi:hypothetical protein